MMTVRHVIDAMIEARHSVALSRYELGAAMKCHEAQLWRVETRRKDLYLSTVIRYLDALGYEIEIVRKR